MKKSILVAAIGMMAGMALTVEAANVSVTCVDPNVAVKPRNADDFDLFASGYPDLYSTNVMITPYPDWTLVKPTPNQPSSPPYIFAKIEMYGSNEGKEYEVTRPPEDTSSGTIYFHNYYIRSESYENNYEKNIVVPEGTTVEYTAHKNGNYCRSDWVVTGTDGRRAKIYNTDRITFNRNFAKVSAWFIPSINGLGFMKAQVLDVEEELELDLVGAGDFVIQAQAADEENLKDEGGLKFLDVTITLEVGDVVCRYSTDPPGRPKITGTVKAEGGVPPKGISVTLTGDKLRFHRLPEDEGEGDTSLDLMLPANGDEVSFAISGQVASTAMDDAQIEARLTAENDGEPRATQNVTVLWVDISMRNTQDADFSEDNHALVVSALHEMEAGLGMQYLNSIQNPETQEWTVSTLAHVVELIGDVSPSNFTSLINFPRVCVGEFMAYREPLPAQPVELANNPTMEMPDPSLPMFQDLLPPENGKIYDIDTPGLPIGQNADQLLIDRVPDTRIFIRYNFKQYTAFNGVRCSDDFEWFLRLTAIKESGVGDAIYSFSPGHNGNQSGKGKTSMWY